MKKEIVSHLGLFAFLCGYAAISFFPILNGDILPDPWETLFDWAGEFYAYSYLAILIGSVNLAPACFIAGLLDRCPSRHTTAFIFTVVCASSVIWHNCFSPFHAFVCGVIISVILSVIYLIARLVSVFAENLWLEQSRIRPA